MAGGKYSRACWKGRPIRGSWTSDNAVSIPVAAHTLQCPLPPIPYNNKHTHTHTHAVGAFRKRSSQVRSTTVSASFSDLNAPTCALPTDPGGKYQLTNLSPRAPKLCRSAICRGTTAACRSAPECQAGGNAGSAKSASARPELSNIGRWSSVPVHRTSSQGEVELRM